MLTLLYNALLLILGAFLLSRMRRRPTLACAVTSLLQLGLFALILAVLLGQHLFAIMRLMSFGIFLHGAGALLILAALLRPVSNRTALLSASLGALVLVIGVDAFFIEPRWLEITRVTIRSTKLHRPLRLAVIADFQTDQIGDYERSVIARVIEERPDVLLLAGDHLQENGPDLAALREELRTLLASLKGAIPMGIYAVRGNVDPPDWIRIFDGLPVTTIDSTTSLDLPEFRLTGLSVDDSFRADLVVPPSERFHVVLGHSPDYALGTNQADLLLAGHTHGGQVRLPLLGPLMTLSRVPRSWAAGTTALPGGRTLIVSRGIGMERGSAPRLRFLCRPELLIIDVTP